MDLDAFDPGEMPAVGAPEPGGLDWYTVNDILKKCFETRDVVGCDIVEMSPVEGSFAPNFMAASLAYRMIGYKFRAPKQEKRRTRGR
jgi:agmatinase